MRNIINITIILITIFLLVNCGNDAITVDPEPFVDHTGEVGTVTDIDGNVYATIGIGGQIWMAENLKVNRYRNGESIPSVTDYSTWQGLTFGANCSYNNDPSNKNTYGLMYNWFAVSDPRGLAPDGWHVPSDDEWDVLINWLGGKDIAGSKLKESGTNHWNVPNSDATNESGFSALPGGWRINLGNYFDINVKAYFWTSTPLSVMPSYVYSNVLCTDSTNVVSLATIKQNGLSVRCVKD